MTERGEHEVTFNGEALSSGLYIYRLEANGQIQSGRMLLVK
jgi:endo-1,4-beta-xylanase